MKTPRAPAVVGGMHVCSSLGGDKIRVVRAVTWLSVFREGACSFTCKTEVLAAGEADHSIAGRVLGIVLGKLRVAPRALA